MKKTRGRERREGRKPARCSRTPWREDGGRSNRRARRNKCRSPKICVGLERGHMHQKYLVRTAKMATHTHPEQYGFGTKV